METVLPVAQIFAALAELLREVHAMRAELSAVTQGNRNRVPRDDVAAKLAPVLLGVYGTGYFTAGEVYDDGHDCTPEAANLRFILGNRSKRQIGKLLAASAGVIFDGIQIERGLNGRAGIAWRMRVCEFETRQTHTKKKRPA